MDKKNEAPKSNTDLMKAIADVIDEALVEYDDLMKNEGIDYAQAIDDKKGQGQGIVGEGHADGMAKEDEEMKPEDKEEDKDEDKDEDHEDDEDEEKLMSAYKSLVAKMEKKGIMHKMEHKKVKKSETAEELNASEPSKDVESLKKSVDERFETLNKTLAGISETIKKLAAQPAPRKGVAGYQPLRKSEGSEEAPALKKSEVVGKLLELKKSGDNRVDTYLINRVETNRLLKADIERLKALDVFNK